MGGKVSLNDHFDILKIELEKYLTTLSSVSKNQSTEKTYIPEVFTHIKSFDYFKTNNYSRLLAFLESPYDVYVMGHSCGLSDRTLLSTIFENPNCRYVKLFYYNSEEKYRETTYELSRHFKDKAEMRKKVLDFTKCVAMPQFQKI